ncbi:APC family permease [Emticicia sp. BO119]|uniref:APC family permease n=1 Tax=Emticicia sp. BO119 TaxID=2757768 RepID=UPI0015F0D835|nr:amino acid permease [Emticicia sp. BO119]MBA4850396.1 amino acid permease [Emticicia sp. BO119]
MENNKLKREIDILGLAANTVNLIIGAGIFILPGLVAAYLAEASLLAYIFCGILMFTIVLCFAEIGSRITTTGGAYAYIHKAFGDYAGFLANTLFWFGTGVLMNAAVINAMADMLAIYLPAMKSIEYRALFFILIFGGFAWVNIRGVKYGNTMVKVNTIIKLIPLLLLILVGVFYVSIDNLQWKSTPSLINIGGASLLLFFAFGGGEAALSVSGEIKNPKRVIPLGILSGIGIVILLYMIIQAVSQGVLGNDLVNHKDAPLAAVAEKIFGVSGATLIIAGGIISIFGSLSGSVLSYPRVLFAGAQSGWFPVFLSKIHPKYATPYWAIIIYAILDFVFAISGGFKQLAIIASASLLTIYLGVVLAVIKFRLTSENSTESTFRLPFGLFIPVVAVIAILWFLSNLKGEEFAGMGIALLILSAVYGVMKLLRRGN